MDNVFSLTIIIKLRLLHVQISLLNTIQIFEPCNMPDFGIR